jgi:F-type H+-transporting ATPase subunit b
VQIDGFTFVAQIINFVILLVLLRLTLYKPILNVMNQREEYLKTQLRDAETQREQTSKEARALRAEQQQLDDQREDLIAQAKTDADEQRRDLEEQARQHVSEVRARWLEDVKREQREFFQELQRNTASEVVSIARQTLSSLAGIELERQIIARFVEQLNAMSDEDRQALQHDPQDQATPLVIRSVFALKETDQARIEQALDTDVPIQFEQADHLICGIELKTPRYEISWSVDAYLDTLNAQITEAFSEISHDTQTEH